MNGRLGCLNIHCRTSSLHGSLRFLSFIRSQDSIANGALVIARLQLVTGIPPVGRKAQRDGGTCLGTYIIGTYNITVHAGQSYGSLHKCFDPATGIKYIKYWIPVYTMYGTYR